MFLHESVNSISSYNDIVEKYSFVISDQLRDSHDGLLCPTTWQECVPYITEDIYRHLCDSELSDANSMQKLSFLCMDISEHINNRLDDQKEVVYCTPNDGEWSNFEYSQLCHLPVKQVFRKPLTEIYYISEQCSQWFQESYQDFHSDSLLTRIQFLINNPSLEKNNKENKKSYSHKTINLTISQETDVIFETAFDYNDKTNLQNLFQTEVDTLANPPKIFKNHKIPEVMLRPIYYGINILLSKRQSC
ncbi:hypothetical protein [Parendozoicomonas haliclonae]|uniref:Uncharacterized protein n=1 Tax=Parendozoicomonas haliclonae TaxID=1960125 RepID=A0A1X7AFV4_9GAMM|nr:hypothetical protein [Parendozoicomonas haliclonae]SMA38484.1 hypothetical protein EHSB41UT_00873 [Parendozoicomonas haliclonae]